MNLTRADMHVYPNPFDVINKEDETSQDTARSVREICEPEGGLGKKCEDFELRFKLQTLGTL